MKISKKDFIREEQIHVSFYRCRECGEGVIIKDNNYCSSCGAEIYWALSDE